MPFNASSLRSPGPCSGSAWHSSAHIPFLGWATVLVWPLVSLAGFVIWLILVLKAYQGQMFKLPVIGDMAEQQAGS